MKLTCYIATSLSNADEAAALAEALAKYGIDVTYPWWVHGSVWDARGGQIVAGETTVEHAQRRCANAAIDERNGVRDADFVIVILCDEEAFGAGRIRQPMKQHGTHAELGIAIALNKPVLLFASSASRFETKETCAFYFMPNVQRRVLTAYGEATRVEQMGAAVFEASVKQAAKQPVPLTVRNDGFDFTPEFEPAKPELGFDAPPARYSQNPDGKETIDRMFDEADRVCANFGTTPGYPTGEPLRLTPNLQRALRAAVCAALALKYEDRKGAKGDPEGDKDKARFYRQMQRRWEQNDASLDPRAHRSKT